MQTFSPRACVLLMDSLGIGASADAGLYGDEGANTFGHILAKAKTPLKLPNLARLGLYHAAVLSAGEDVFDISTLAAPESHYGYAVEQSKGKDTPSGHWELAGVPVRFEWGYFPKTTPCFPSDLISKLIERANIPGVLGEIHASGTDILKSLGEMHQQTGKPIVYTSGDSVFQIAAHEETFGLKRLYELCEIARELVDTYQVGRVIARPFIGEPGAFKRTGNRRDYSVLPPKKTLLDDLNAAGREVIAIGKIADIFAHSGPTQVIKADGNMALFDATLEAMKTAPPGSLVFTNFVDFDSSFGHRRDVEGYAKALEAFDARIPELEAILKADDCVLISADHGCDPTFPGSDHTREHVPVLAFGPNIQHQSIGRRASFSDMGKSLATHLALASEIEGTSFFDDNAKAKA
jgi:phosphopentomutase